MTHSLLAHLTDRQIEYIGKEWQRVNLQRLRARAMGKPATLTLDEWLTIIDRYNGLCAYCKKVPFEGMEHMRSLSHDGGTTADNVVPTCLSCNSRKGMRTAWHDLQTGELVIHPYQPILPVKEVAASPVEKPSPLEQWLHPKNAATLLDLPVKEVLKLVRKGKLRATWISKVNRRISLASCNAYLMTQQREKG